MRGYRIGRGENVAFKREDSPFPVSEGKISRFVLQPTRMKGKKTGYPYFQRRKMA